MSVSSHQAPGIQGARDDKGISTVTVSHWCETVAEVYSHAASQTQFFGLTLRSWDFANWDAEDNNAGFQVDLQYQGIASGDEPPGQTENWEIDNSFRQEPIESHPDIKHLLEQFGGSLDSSGKAQWVEELPRGASLKGQTLGLRGKTGQFGEDNGKNPLFGLETFLDFGSVFRLNFAVRELTADLKDDIGTIVDRLPIPEADVLTPDDRDWLVLPLKAKYVGPDARDIAKEYMLGPKGGWPPPVYDLIQI